jgi:hypothetical protein
MAKRRFENEVSMLGSRDVTTPDFRLAESSNK